MKLASFGALVHGSTGHFFYNFLDSKMPGTNALTVVKKVFIDQASHSLSQPSRAHAAVRFRCLYSSTAVPRPNSMATVSSLVGLRAPSLVLGACYHL